MGSTGEDIPRQDDEIRIVVTGFGPFRAQYPLNPSWEIASRLPAFLPPSNKSKAAESHDASTHSEANASKHTPRIHIITFPQPVHVSYPIVRSLVPILLDSQPKADYVLHIGMASGRNFYSVERRGHRDEYFMRDVDGQLLGDEVRRIQEGDDWIWAKCPEELLTSLPFDDMFEQWKSSLPEVDARISEDAGNYLCDFIYFSSLAHYFNHGRERKAMFLHVPVNADNISIQKGVEVTIELIRSMVETDLKARKGAVV